MRRNFLFLPGQKWHAGERQVLEIQDVDHEWIVFDLHIKDQPERAERFTATRDSFETAMDNMDGSIEV